MHASLSAALANGEFFALYQPQIATLDGRVAGVEALLRWQRPGFGIIEPSDFVTIAEKQGLIAPLGAFMLERACQTAAAWGELKLGINVSPLQFARVDFADVIFAIAGRANLPLHRLEIEITETAAFGDLEAAKATLAQLRARGVSIALDDLGSGLATPALMRALPLDRVKLGKEVVVTCQTPEGAALVRGLICAARDLGLGVTAEGVETQAEQEFLQACGCDLLQGYLFARPMTGIEFTSFLRHRLD